MKTNDSTTTQDATTRTSAARSAVAFARRDIEAKASAERDARAQLEVATVALQDKGSPDSRRAVLEAEQNLSLAILEKAGADTRLSRADAELKQAQADEAAATLAKRAEAVTAGAFAAVVAQEGLAKKRATLAAQLADVDTRAAALVKGFEVEATEVHGSPRVEFGRLFTSLVARAAGLSASLTLRSVWQAGPVAGLADTDVLAAHERGVTDLARRLASLRAAEASAAACSKALVDRCHLPTSRSAARDTTVLGQCESSIAEARAIRAALIDLGFKGAADAVTVDPLAAALDAAGPAAVAQAITALRSAEFLPLSAADREAKNPMASLAARKQAQADSAWKKIEAWPEIAKHVERPTSKPAASVATRSTQFGSFDVDVRA